MARPGVVTVGFLHTADAHVETFDALIAAAEPAATAVHLVDGALLASARRDGADHPHVTAAVETRLGLLIEDGADAVLCTCSTIGAAAEAMSDLIGVPVLRVDRPMAAAAVEVGSRIGVIAALSSTLRPTGDLLREEARRRGVDVEVVELPCFEAWPYFEAGDEAAYIAAVAEHVDAVANSVDVVVLAQASMAPAADRCEAERVLASPRLGVRALLESARRSSRRGRASAIGEQIGDDRHN